jgi:STAM-binding protein
MTKHQANQGYAPSLASMFNPSMKAPTVPASLLFEPDSKAANLYSSNMLPQPSAPANIPQTYGMTTAQSNQPRPHHSDTYPPVSRALSQRQSPQPTSDSSRIVRSLSKTDPVNHELKNVNLPRDCLPRFLSIAAVNTARNRETCGLLLGKDKGHKFVVTTLLIPKQHSTSDTCTMDEEELVMQFTEERNLITLGWVSPAVIHCIRMVF